MKALVTGATGFIGSHVAQRLLERGDDVYALTRTDQAAAYGLGPIVWVQGDLTDPASLVRVVKDVDVIYHAAALMEAPSDTMLKAVNVTGVQNLLDACAEHQIKRFVFLSSVAAYAPSPSPVVTESASLGGQSAYGRSKAEAERLIRYFAGARGLQYSIIRPCVVYGERDKGNFTPRLLRLFSSSIIAAYGGRGEHMNLVYVTDVADAVVKAGTHPVAAGQAYNVAGARQTSVWELCQILMELSGKRKLLVPIPLSFLRGGLIVRWLAASILRRRFAHLAERFRNREYQRTFFVSSQRYDISKARTELGFEPKVDFREGLRRTWEWHLKRQRVNLEGTS